MRFCIKLFTVILLLVFSSGIYSQKNFIKYNNQNLFLSGTNLAWISFANDIGTGNTDYKTFADVLLQVHENGGNSMRWWIHTDGTASPEFDNLGNVISPGATSIQEIKKVLDLAWEREVGVVLCLWSFDMLESSKSAAVKSRNNLLLTDTTYTRAYINNALIPMVDSLKGHPGIIAWEIFNEPEGMTNLLTWNNVGKVPITAIQRFVNLCAGAIHRTDPNALVTNGSQSVAFISDIAAPPLAKVSDVLSKMSEFKKREIEDRFFKKYGFKQTAEQLLTPTANYNYYSNSRLIAEGGDSDGTLDFYTFHFYSNGDNIGLSPFNRNASQWNLDKPIVVGEFHVVTTYGVPPNLLISTAYNNGYAGAWAWSWTDNATTQKADILTSLKSMWNSYKDDVDVVGIGGDFPTVKITSPANNAKFPSGAEVTITADAADADGTIFKVEFFANDTIKIGEVTALPYSVIWKNIPNGEFKITAVAYDNLEHARASTVIKITIGTPPITKLEAEAAQKQGSDLTVLSDATASKGACVYLKGDNNSKITWQFNNYSAVGSYEIAFGYRHRDNTPKSQYINVNGTRVTELKFDGGLNTWLEKKLTVDLIQGSNTVQMEKSWGYMDVDYLAIPTIIVTSVAGTDDLPMEFSLDQNYPNPFNPVTTINYSIAKAGLVKLAVYDILGRQIAVLVNEIKNTGEYKLQFNAGSFASGIYFYRIEAGDFSAAKQMILLK